MARKLTRREKYSIYAASGIICLFVVIQFIVFPTVDKRENQERALKVKTKMLEEMVALKSEYDAEGEDRLIEEIILLIENGQL